MRHAGLALSADVVASGGLSASVVTLWLSVASVLLSFVTLISLLTP